MYCSKCGAKNTDDSNFCVQCGFKLNSAYQSSPQQKSTILGSILNSKEYNSLKSGISFLKQEQNPKFKELPVNFSGQTLAYQYTNEICFMEGQKDTEKNIKYALSHIGSQIYFIKEPTNKFDSNAVAIYLKGKKLGYVYRGKNQDMINDWLSRGDHIVGYISGQLNQRTVFYKIGFYK